MTSKHNSKHVTPPNRNKKSTLDTVKEAQEEYQEASRKGSTPAVKPSDKTFKKQRHDAPKKDRPSQGD